MSRSRRNAEDYKVSDEPERVLLVGVQFAATSTDAAEHSMDELAALAESAGGIVVGRVVQRRDRPDPATFIGRGKAQLVADEARSLNADLTVFDDDLAPAQQRNLDELIPGRILDRTTLILDIFASRAHSSEGKTQVELAQLNYLLPRLRGWGTALSRIRGTSGAVGGGGRSPIGARGPGETQLEVDRRKIMRRLYKLQRDLKAMSRRRNVARKLRAGRMVNVSLVGYTNAGKSTVLNHLTGAGVATADRLFETLDPTARRVKMPDGRYIVLSDTVGFIRKLPHGLVEAFKSTLEEVAAADVLIHVVDASHSEPELDIAAVEEVLVEIGATDAPRVVALNKVDRLTDEQRQMLRNRFPSAIAISAVTGESIGELLAAVSAQLEAQVAEVEVLLPYEQGALVARLHDEGRAVSVAYEPGGVRMVVRGRGAELAALQQWFVDDSVQAI